MQALILAGGSGTRFWPASRRRRPKQLLPLLGDRTLLRLTFDRLRPLVGPGDVWIATGRELGEVVRRELPEVPPEQILLEPEGRNTAPAIAWILATMPAAKRGDVVVSLHSDHSMEDEDAFRSALAVAAAAVAERGGVVALGVRPRWAETGYGWLETAEPIGVDDGRPRMLRVVRFREKPDAATAEAFVSGGRHLWNAGIFVFRGSALLDQLARLEPAIARGVAAAAAEPARLDAIWADLPAAPIDTAVMERLDELHTVVLDCGWSDLGSWAALAEAVLARAAGAAGNVAHGDTVAIDASDNLLWSEDGVVAVLGVEGLAVVQSGGAVLVVPKERSQEVRRLVDELRRRGRRDLL